MADTVSVMFKKGLLANLPSAKTAGTFYVTTDERAMYLDVDGENRIRIGDFQEVASLDALAAIANPSTTALYYVADINVLAKYNGSKFITINLDTGATDIEVVGTGNAVTAASYDATTRKITLTKGAKFEADGAADAVKSELLGESTDTSDKITLYGVKAYAKEQADAVLGESTDAATANTVYGAKAAAAAAKSAADAAQGDVDDLEELVGEIPDTATATTVTGYAKEVADSKDAAIAAAKKAGDNAQAAADAKVASVAAGDDSVTVGGTATAPTVAAKLDETAGNALKLVEGKGLRVDIPSADVYGLVKDDDSGDFAAVYHLTKNNENIGAAINIPKDMVVKEGSVVTDPEGQPKGTYIKLVLQNVTDPLYIDVGSLIEYVTSGSQATDMVVIAVSDDHKVTASITDGTITLAKLHADVQTEINKAHTHDNKTVLDGITADKVSAWDTAATKAAANESAISAIKDGESIDSFGDVETALAGKQDTIPANTYDAYGAASTAKSEVIGESTDAKTADTVNGAKAFATDAVNAAKTDLVGTADDDKDADTIKGAKAYADAALASGLAWGSF